MLPVKYVPRFEFDEVKTALEIAEDEYRRATDEAAKWDKISCVISDKCGKYNNELEALNKTFRNLAGRYKRSTKEDTRNRLYYQMRILYRQIEAIKPAVEWLQRMYDKASAQYLHERDKELAATRNVVNARAAAGLKFGVHINLELGGQKIPLSDNVKTIADAVNFICQNTNGLASWVIYTESVNGLTTRRNIIAEGKNIDREILSALIKKHGDSTIVIDAEIATPQKAKAPHFDTPAEEFMAIAFRAMHYFTLGDFLTPINELRAFYRKNKWTYVERELAEWIKLATDNGVEVPAEIIETPAAEIAVETFALAPADSPDVEEFISDGIIRDTQFAICTITSWLPVIRRHEKVAAEWKAERTAHLRQNISRLKAGVAVLTAAGYLRRASWLVQAEKRLDFL